MSTTEGSVHSVDKIRALWANPQISYPISMIAYLLVFGILFTALMPKMGHSIDQLEAFTAYCVTGFLSAFTEFATLRGNVVSLDGFSVLVIMECVGLFEMLIYTSCVLAFPAPRRAKLWGVPIGCGAIFGFNILRIAMLLVVGRHWNEYFDFFHIYFWQATLIAMIVAVLHGWIKVFVPR